MTQSTHSGNGMQQMHQLHQPIQPIQVLHALFDGFTDYVSQHVIVVNPKTRQVHITYAYFTYDLIDKDLDFDEAYYTKFMSNFRKVLFEECKTVIASPCGIDTYDTVDITCAKLIMKGEAVVEHCMTLDKTGSTFTSYTNETYF
jgi:hypothetical protein